jgi:hypothetical protein
MEYTYEVFPFLYYAYFCIVCLCYRCSFVVEGRMLYKQEHSGFVISVFDFRFVVNSHWTTGAWHINIYVEMFINISTNFEWNILGGNYK